MASEYELENRKHHEDSRRQLFAKQIELIEHIDSKFALWEKEDIKKTLKEHPFDDDK
jgi:hypothetical protein